MTDDSIKEIMSRLDRIEHNILFIAGWVASIIEVLIGAIAYWAVDKHLDGFAGAVAFIVTMTVCEKTQRSQIKR